MNDPAWVKEIIKWMNSPAPGPWDGREEWAPHARGGIRRMRAMLRLLAEANQALLRTWKRAGPSGSGQMEKFDWPVHLAEVANDAYESGVLPKGESDEQETG